MKVLFLAIVSIFFLLFSPPIFAQVGSSAATPTAPEQEYALPYPGMLPDNPFYFLKTLRDTAISFLISNPQKKAEFEILQADKKTAAGMYLILQKKKYQLGVKTMEEGNDHAKVALEQLREAKEQGITEDELVKKLHASLDEHTDVIKRLKVNAPDELVRMLNPLQQKINTLQQSVEQELPEK